MCLCRSHRRRQRRGGPGPSPLRLRRPTGVGELLEEAAILLGEDDPPAFAELQDLIAFALHGRSWRTQRVPRSLATVGAWLQDRLPLGGDPFVKPWMVERAADHYALDTSRVRTLLGWRAKRSLVDTVPVIATALKDDPEGWYRANGFDPEQAAR